MWVPVAWRVDTKPSDAKEATRSPLDPEREPRQGNLLIITSNPVRLPVPDFLFLLTPIDDNALEQWGSLNRILTQSLPLNTLSVKLSLI